MSDEKEDGAAPTVSWDEDTRGAGSACPGRDGEAIGSPKPGHSWGKYLIERHLGGGGQGEVYQAYDRLGAAGHVALKVCRRPLDAEALQEWATAETGPLVKLDHPNIVKAVDAGCVGQIPYVATRLVEGRPLDEYAKTHPPSATQVLDWMIQLADAIAAAHDAGVTHRDLKPGNVVMGTDGRPMVIDLGMARLVSPYLELQTAGSPGTPPFAAPEQARREVSADHRVDVFGLGGILKSLLTGEGPYGRLEGGEQYLRAARENQVQLVESSSGPSLRRALARIANRALAPDADQRYPTAREMLGALRRLRSRRRLVPACLAGVGLLAALAAAVANWSGGTAGAGQPSADLEIHFQRADQTGAYQVLAADLLPLRDGDRIQAHARFSEPLFVYLLAMSSTGQTTVLYPRQAGEQKATKAMSVPPGRDQWLPLTPPGGTETILLLGRREALSNPADLGKRVLSYGAPPTVDGVGMLVCDGADVRFVENRSATHRVIGDKPVTVNKGLLTALVENGNGEWTVVRAVSFTHAERPQDDAGTRRGQP